MTDFIDYYFTAASPFAYLGHETLVSIAEKHDKKINFKPFDIMGVWEISGAVPPGQRPPVRQRYRLVEIQRVAIMRNMTINPAPTYFPTNPALADNCICALILAGENPAEFSKAAGRAVWESELQIADENTIRGLLTECNHDAEAILKLAGEESAAAMRKQNTQDAVENDAIGAPAYVYNGEVFWGQDRLEYLEQMIASGRKAFTVVL